MKGTTPMTAQAQRNPAVHGHRYEEADKTRGAKLLKAKGATVADVAKELGISVRTLRRWATERGVDCPGNRKYDHEKIRSLLEHGKTTGEVASLVGCSVRLVRAVRAGEV